MDDPALVTLLGNERAYEVVLLVDTGENETNTRSATGIAEQLNHLGVRCELHQLVLGDYLWVGRPSRGGGGEEEWVVLDCVVERKTAQDLASSIIDLRWVEQLLRLRTCLLRKATYLVEGHGTNTHSCRKDGTPAVSVQALRTAMAETHLAHGVQVVQTTDQRHTLQVLEKLHRRVCRRFARGECRYAARLDGTRLYLPFSVYQKRNKTRRTWTAL